MTFLSKLFILIGIISSSFRASSSSKNIQHEQPQNKVTSRKGEVQLLANESDDVKKQRFQVSL